MNVSFLIVVLISAFLYLYHIYGAREYNDIGHRARSHDLVSATVIVMLVLMCVKTAIHAVVPEDIANLVCMAILTCGLLCLLYGLAMFMVSVLEDKDYIRHPDSSTDYEIKQMSDLNRKTVTGLLAIAYTLVAGGFVLWS